MKRGFIMVANFLVAVGSLALAGLPSSAAAFAGAAPAAEGARLPAEWYFAYGARYDEQALKALSSESFSTGPSTQPHFARTGDAPVVVDISGTHDVVTDDHNWQGTPANRSEGGRSQIGWLLPAPQACSRAVSALSGGGS